MATDPAPVDLTRPDQLALAVRIGSAWVEMRRGAVMSALRDHLFGVGDDALDQGQSDTLDLLAQQPSWRMSELADALRVDPSTATRAIQRLVNDGLAVRQPSEQDGRVVMVSITRDGRRRHRAVQARRAQLFTHLFAHYTPDEREQLAELLERFIAAVDDFVSRVDDADAADPAPAVDVAGDRS